MDRRCRSVFYRLTVLLLITGLSATSAHAFGKKRKKPPKEPADVQAFPVRYVSIGEFYNTPFTLPDDRQTLVDVGATLPLVTVTEMTETRHKLRPNAPGTESRYRLRGGITSFEANITQFGLRFGWKPGQGDLSNGSLSGAEGKVDVKVGELGMDFYIEDLGTEPASVVVAKHSNVRELGLNLNAKIDFSEYDTGADFVYKSPLAPMFRKMIKRAIEKMIKDPWTNFLMDWDASVTHVDLRAKKVFFNSGLRDDVKKHNVFTIYDGRNRLGEVKVNDAQVMQSGASFKNDSKDKLLKSVRPGDSVRIYYLKTPN